MQAEERRPWGPHWRRQAAGIAAGLGALVLSVGAVALATALLGSPAEPLRPVQVSAAAPGR